ncbi:MAG: sugar ABC transporter substrate-binding protein [Treponema sp.]|jgi:ribose transport system substrate-binding protein|nr:sugar ABC transporter substrate-binding protein [Treponema sp.]
MKTKKIIMAIALVFTLTGFVFAGGGAQSGPKAGKKLVIGFNNYLQGHYSLDILENSFKATCAALDIEPYILNDEGKSENSAYNVDNMINAGVDGVVFFGIVDTLFPVVAKKCTDAGIPFVFFDHMPSDETLAQVVSSPYYKGIAATVDYGTGANFGTHALELGLKKAVVITGERGDTTHTARTTGFTETFTKGGGTVLAQAYGPVDLQSALTRSNDTLTAHPDADCIYATNGDVGTSVLEAVAKHPGMNAKVFVTDLDPSVLDGLKNGKVAAGNGAHWVNVDFATALLVNALRGNEIKENGRAPRLVVPVMTLPSNLIGLYDKYWLQQQPFSPDEMRSWVGPNVTVDVFKNTLANYNINTRLDAKVKQGLLSQAELDAARKQ